MCPFLETGKKGLPFLDPGLEYAGGGRGSILLAVTTWHRIRNQEKSFEFMCNPYTFVNPCS